MVIKNNINLLHGNCLDIMNELPDKSVDMILCDLPYGTSACKWDSIIPFEPLWDQYERLITDTGAIVLFATQPFTSKLVMSNPNRYKYNWVWIKENATNFLNKKFQPGKITEDICVFSKGASSYANGCGRMAYYPQMEEGKPYRAVRIAKGRQRESAVIRTERVDCETVNETGLRYPNNVLYFKRDKQKLHPTQKPVPLLEYLIRTYTNESETVLDNTMGSGSTGVACVHTGRRFIGIELDEKWFDVAKERISAEAESGERIADDG